MVWYAYGWIVKCHLTSLVISNNWSGCVGKVYKLTWPNAFSSMGGPLCPLPRLFHISIMSIWLTISIPTPACLTTVGLLRSYACRQYLTTSSPSPQYFPLAITPFFLMKKPMLFFFSPGWAPQYVAYTQGLKYRFLRIYRYFNFTDISEISEKYRWIFFHKYRWSENYLKLIGMLEKLQKMIT